MRIVWLGIHRKTAPKLPTKKNALIGRHVIAGAADAACLGPVGVAPVAGAAGGFQLAAVEIQLADANPAVAAPIPMAVGVLETQVVQVAPVLTSTPSTCRCSSSTRRPTDGHGHGSRVVVFRHPVTKK